MTLYQLGKIAALAGILSTRKRVQKIVHLLKAAGCPIEADFRLHYYGPYSDDVASALNQLVEGKVLSETELPAGESGRQFKYRLSELGKRTLHDYEKTAVGRAAAEQFEPFKAMLRKLLETDLTTLELASTIVFNRQAGRDWPRAVEETATFKRVPRSSPSLKSGEQLARSIVT